MTDRQIEVLRRWFGVDILAELRDELATLTERVEAAERRVVAVEEALRRLPEDHELVSATHMAGGIGLACVCGWQGPMCDGEFELVESWDDHLHDVVSAALSRDAGQEGGAGD